jgi:hypothetical protein
VTFTTEGGGEYDVARKSWGFYATPSLNGRLAGFRLRGVIVRNRLGRVFVLLVERGKEALFEAYVSDEALDILHWVDDDTTAASFSNKLKEASPSKDEDTEGSRPAMS